jgi:hypothetical protein
LAITFFGCTFYKGHMYIFEISTKRRIFWYPIRPNQRKKFLITWKRQWNFLRTEKVKNGRNRSKFRRTVFDKQILDFNCPLKILCHTSKLRNFVKITGPYCGSGTCCLRHIRIRKIPPDPNPGLIT